MSYLPEELADGPVGQALRGRCQQLGLPAWRACAEARLMSGPVVAGVAGRWLASPALHRRLSAALKPLRERAEVTETELFPGARVLILTERTRRVVTGFTLVLILSPACVEGEAFDQITAEARLEPAATREAVARLARFTPESIPPIIQALRLMTDDLSRQAETDETIAGFTRQLTDGFETIDLLYTLGRSMNDLGKPRQFIELVADRLHSSMPFLWLAAAFVGEARAAELVGDPLFLLGRGVTDGKVLAAAQALAPTLGVEGKSRLFTDLHLCGPETKQVLVQPIVRSGRLFGMFLCGGKHGDDPQISSYDIHLVEAAAGYVGAFLDNALLYADQQAMFLGMVRSLTAAIDAKDRYTRGHSERVAHLGKLLALQTGLDEAYAERVHIAGLVHDVGKIGVPEAVLSKRGKLTDEEFGQIKLHPEIGHRILQDIPHLGDVLPGVLYHHERFDGRGYPHKLAGEAIPLQARLLALADTFDAMSSTRSYRAAMPREQVLNELRRCAGAQFDPALTEHFVRLDFTEYDEMVQRHGAGDTAPANPPAQAAAPEPHRLPADAPPSAPQRHAA